VSLGGKLVEKWGKIAAGQKVFHGKDLPQVKQEGKNVFGIAAIKKGITILARLSTYSFISPTPPPACFRPSFLPALIFFSLFD